MPKSLPSKTSTETGTSTGEATAAVPMGPRLHEDSIWSAVGAEWRRLGGSFRRHGFSFEWHDLENEVDVDWSASFHAGSVEICLNLEGEGHVASRDTRIDFRTRTAGFYVSGQGPLEARRHGLQPHRFITAELSPEFLRRHLAMHRDSLHAVIRSVVESNRARSAVGEVLPLTARQHDLIASLRQPPVLLEAQVLWYQAKALELVVEFFFRPPDDGELFCARARRMAHGRVEKVVAILRERLVDPPTLDELGRLVGCSPFYLSRTFSGEMGMTISQYLRQLRLDRAAELLRSGDFNVTEAALEVGYNSLSHFSQAFHEQFGCCPGLYPVATVPQKSLRPPPKGFGSRRGSAR